MAKKANVFNQESYQDLKQELNNIVEFILDFDIESTEDDIEWKPTAKGGIAPSVVSTIEEKVKTLLMIIEQSARILKSLHEKEGMNPETSYNIKAVVNKLKTVQYFYKQTPIKEVTHRKITKELGRDKKGNPKFIEFLVATRDKIIQARSSMLEKILKIMPLIEEIESYEIKFTVKGTGEGLPSGMLYD